MGRLGVLVLSGALPMAFVVAEAAAESAFGLDATLWATLAAVAALGAWATRRCGR